MHPKEMSSDEKKEQRDQLIKEQIDSNIVKKSKYNDTIARITDSGIEIVKMNEGKKSEMLDKEGISGPYREHSARIIIFNL